MLNFLNVFAVFRLQTGCGGLVVYSGGQNYGANVRGLLSLSTSFKGFSIRTA